MADESEDLSGLGSTRLGASFKERSANLRADPKMRELRRYRGIVSAEKEADATTRRPMSSGTLGVSASWHIKRPTTVGTVGMSGGGPQNVSRPSDEKLRSEGREAIERHLKRLATQKAELPHIGPACKQLPECFQKEKAATSPTPLAPAAESFDDVFRRLDRGPAKTHMRGKMDRALQRMMLDLELAQDERLTKYAPQARCAHLDRMYDWYKQHKPKDATPGLGGPAYVKFRPDAHVMPGSTRVAPLAWHSGATLGHASSSPSLTVAGSSLGIEDSTPKARGRVC